MEDRQAQRRRPLTQGIPFAPQGGIPLDREDTPLEGGIPAGNEDVFGVPTGPIITSKPEGPRKCTSTTKKGDPCRAYATAGGKLCVGHGG